MRFAPFDPLCPPKDRADRVASPPYDVVNTEEARALAADNPESFLHVIRPEIDLPIGTAFNDERVYGQARKGFAALQDRGALQRFGRKGVFVYRQKMGEHVQTGIVGCCHVKDYENDLIKKHEKTRPDKEDDRTRHLMELQAHPGPVFLLYNDHAGIDEIMAKSTEGESLYHLVAEDGVEHTLWECADSAAVVTAFENDIPCSYVADGHHRSASAMRAAQAMREKHPDAGDDAEFEWFLSVLFPASQLQILAYNRVVFDLTHHDEQEFLHHLREVVDVSDEPMREPPQTGQVGMYLGGKWWGITFPADKIPSDDPVESLDCSLLQNLVLAPLLEIEDPRLSNRIAFVGGIHGPDRLEKMVDERPGSVAFSMHPVTVGQLIAVSDAGKIMPPKSTWFEPKLRSGLLVHTF